MKKYKVPKSIRVGGRIFKIKVYKKQPIHLIKELGTVGGWFDWSKGEIGLVKNHGADLSVLFHEIGHAAGDCVKATNPMRNESFARPFFAIFLEALKEAGIIKLT